MVPFPSHFSRMGGVERLAMKTPPGFEGGHLPASENSVSDANQWVNIALRNFDGPLRDYLAVRIPGGMKSRIVVEEVLQEIWVAAFKSAMLLTTLSEIEFRNWMYRVANRCLVTAIRYHSTQRRNAGREQPSPDLTTSLVNLFEQIPGPQRTPSSVAMGKEIAVEMRAAIEQLPEAYRSVVWKHHIQGQSLSEIAEAQGTSVAAVRGMLYRAMVYLGKIMKHHAPKGSSG